MTALMKRPSGIVDPSMLSARQRRALGLAGKPGTRLIRSKGGWGFLPDRVSLDVAASLVGLDLCRVDRSGRHPELVLTGSGQMVRAVVEQRKARRQG
jgi:hypothetical protein